MNPANQYRDGQRKINVPTPENSFFWSKFPLRARTFQIPLSIYKQYILYNIILVDIFLMVFYAHIVSSTTCYIDRHFRIFSIKQTIFLSITYEKHLKLLKFLQTYRNLYINLGIFDISNISAIQFVFDIIIISSNI